jgi:hypothetical protein
MVLEIVLTSINVLILLSNFAIIGYNKHACECPPGDKS